MKYFMKCSMKVLTIFYWLGSGMVFAFQEDCFEPTPSPAVLRLEYYRQFIAAALPVAESYYYQARLDDARAIVETALAMASEMGSDMDDERVQLLVVRGKLQAYACVLRNAGYEEAQATLAEARVLAEEQGDRSALAATMTYTGLVRYTRVMNGGKGKTQEALDDFDKSLQLREVLGDCRGMAETLTYAGQAHARLNRNKTAMELFQRAANLARDQGYKLEWSNALRHMALNRRQRGDTDGALRDLETSLKLREEIGFKIGLPFAYLSVGQIHFAKGEVDKALEYFEKAYASALESGEGRVIAASLLPIGDVYQAQENLEVALHYYRQVKTLAQEIGFRSAVRLAEARMASLPEVSSDPP